MRSHLLTLACLAVLPAGFLGCSGPGPSLAAGNLHCEHRIEPQGIGETKPRLDWTLTALDPRARNLRQTAYRVLVASTPERDRKSVV